MSSRMAFMTSCGGWGGRYRSRRISISACGPRGGPPDDCSCASIAGAAPRRRHVPEQRIDHRARRGQGSRVGQGHFIVHPGRVSDTPAKTIAGESGPKVRIRQPMRRRSGRGDRSWNRRSNRMKWSCEWATGCWQPGVDRPGLRPVQFRLHCKGERGAGGCIRQMRRTGMTPSACPDRGRREMHPRTERSVR